MMFAAIESYPFSFGEQIIKITISVGIYKTSKDELFDQALKIVDKELYKAKEKGKNTISVFFEH